jgi:hypothetical protein
MASACPRVLVATLVALALATSPGDARAAASAQASPEYTSATSRTRDETGRESRVDLTQWIQRYRLAVDQQIYPLLSFAAGANLNWNTSDIRSEGVSQSSDTRTWNTYARLSAGERVLNGALDYTRRWEDIEARSEGVTIFVPQRVRESYTGTFAWQPADLPALALRLSRSNTYDEGRLTIDQTSDEAQLSLGYSPDESVDLRYAARYGRSTDRLSDVVRSDLSNSGTVIWHGTYLGGRGSAYASYSLSTQTTDTSAPRAGTTVAEQRFPVAGLSIVEVFPATPTSVTLNANAALVDGDAGTRAGVNLGTSASTGNANADAFRDFGAQFQDVVTPVNVIYVWVDHQLPAALSSLFTWTAYQSDDNASWTLVDTSPAVFNEVLLRFEVPIARTAARYLKVVAKPLLSTATTDPQFAEIFVTELQFFELIPAELARGRTSDLSGALNATTRLVLVPDLGLAYDFSGLVAHGTGRPETWSMTNGLSLARRLDPVFAVAARVERSDSDFGAARQALNRWSGALSADPLPTFGAVVGYSGQLAQLSTGNTLTNTGTVSARAELYEGLSLSSGASLSLAHADTGVETRSAVVSASASVVPNRKVSLTGAASHNRNAQSGGGQPSRTDSRTLLEAGAFVSPVPALSLSGTVSRQFGGDTRPTTLITFAGVLSPFPGGDLQLRYTYAESFDTSADLRTRSHGPSATWKIRSGWFARASYSFLDSSAPAQTMRSRTLNANLLITFR